MADKSTTVNNLKIEVLFVDGDTRVITLKNPRDDIEISEITDLESVMKDLNGDPATPLLVGDKANAAFRRINMVVIESVTTGILDLS